jgi:hypothetical protein
MLAHRAAEDVWRSSGYFWMLLKGSLLARVRGCGWRCRAARNMSCSREWLDSLEQVSPPIIRVIDVGPR